MEQISATHASAPAAPGAARPASANQRVETQNPLRSSELEGVASHWIDDAKTCDPAQPPREAVPVEKKRSWSQDANVKMARMAQAARASMRPRQMQAGQMYGASSSQEVPPSWISRWTYKLCSVDGSSSRSELIAFGIGATLGTLTLCGVLIWTLVWVVIAATPAQRAEYASLSPNIGGYVLPNPLWNVLVLALPILGVQVSYLLSWSYFHDHAPEERRSTALLTRGCSAWFWAAIALLPLSPIFALLNGVLCCLACCGAIDF